MSFGYFNCVSVQINTPDNLESICHVVPLGVNFQCDDAENPNKIT